MTSNSDSIVIPIWRLTLPIYKQEQNPILHCYSRIRIYFMLLLITVSIHVQLRVNWYLTNLIFHCGSFALLFSPKDSIMLLGDEEFSKAPGLRTMVAKNGQLLPPLSLKFGLTATDAQVINRMYGCWFKEIQVAPSGKEVIPRITFSEQDTSSNVTKTLYN